MSSFLFFYGWVVAFGYMCIADNAIVFLLIKDSQNEDAILAEVVKVGSVDVRAVTIYIDFSKTKVFGAVITSVTKVSEKYSSEKMSLPIGQIP